MFERLCFKIEVQKCSTYQTLSEISLNEEDFYSHMHNFSFAGVSHVRKRKPR
jgi:hypothetical protein